MSVSIRLASAGVVANALLLDTPVTAGTVDAAATGTLGTAVTAGTLGAVFGGDMTMLVVGESATLGVCVREIGAGRAASTLTSSITCVRASVCVCCAWYHNTTRTCAQPAAHTHHSTRHSTHHARRQLHQCGDDGAADFVVLTPAQCVL
jgi:hypothetical protein